MPIIVAVPLDGRIDLCRPQHMFIRRTHHKKKRAGGYYYTYRIVESQRISTKVYRRIVLNLGADFTLAKEQWPLLTRRIKEILGGQQSLVTIDSHVDKPARNCAARILAKNRISPRKHSRLPYRGHRHSHYIQAPFHWLRTCCSGGFSAFKAGG